MVATAAIVIILASAVLPLTRVARTRMKEIELRRSLREIRTAIDRFKIDSDHGKIGGTDLTLDGNGYPKDLETLVKGVSQVGTAGHKLKYLRHIPVDPMTGNTEWGQRCYQDDPDADSWCGSNVWDIYSKSRAKGLDGTNYRDW
jgi:general secretion pathway protein G